MSLTICCVETNNYAGRGFDYVRALRNAVRKRVTAPHRFVVLTDAPYKYKGVCDAIQAPANAPGWWSKLALFRKGLFDTERTLFFDLDTLIIANIDDLAAYDGPFAGLGDFRDGKGRFCSGVMAWPNDGALHHIWEKWLAADCPNMAGGDDHWINAVHPGAAHLQFEIPGIVSYKFHHCKDQPPDGARIVCFQREPKPHNCESEWVRFVWRP
jgi:hypothetical protein